MHHKAIPLKLLRNLGFLVFLSGYFFFQSTSVSAQPTVISNQCLAWFRADSLTGNAGDQISSWPNLAVLNDAVQTIPVLRPTLSDLGLNGTKSVKFGGGSEKKMVFTNIHLNQDAFTVLVLLKRKDYTNTIEYAIGGSAQGLSSGGANASYKKPAIYNGTSRLFSQAIIDTNWTFLTYFPDSILINFHNYGNTSQQLPIPGLDLSTLGSRADAATLYYNGYIAEVEVFGEVLNNTQLNYLKQYLAGKYGRRPILGPDITLSATDNCNQILTGGAGFSSYLWNTGDTTSTLQISTPGTYWLRTTDQFGFVLSDTIEVRFASQDIAKNQIICAGDSLQWNLGLSSGFTYSWSDGSTQGIDYLKPDSNYSVSITNQQGCTWHSDTILTSSDNYRDSVSLGPDLILCAGNLLALRNGANGAVSYNWNTGSSSAHITLEQSGDYWVQATDVNGCVGSDTIHVTILGQAPDVQIGHGVLCATRMADLYDLTAPPVPADTITDRQWDLGTLGASADSALSVQFPTPGSYPVSLQVTLQDGCYGLAHDTVVVHNLPQVQATNPLICSGETAVFEDVSSTVPGYIASHQWSFANGDTGTGVTIQVNFAQPGTDTLQLISTNNWGCADTLVRGLTIYGSPIPDFTPMAACLGNPTLFQQEVDTTLSGPVQYNWQFGDGFYSFFPNTSHTYSAPGHYDVTLTARSTQLGTVGCQASVTHTVSVYGNPTASFSANDTCAGDPVVATDNSQLWSAEDSIANYTWQFGDVGSDTGEMGMFAFAQSGTYTITEHITTASGCVSQATGVVTILGIPTAGFTASVQPGLPADLSLENTTEGATSYEWDFGDGSTAAGALPNHTYTDTGSFAITLTALNGNLCSDTAVGHVKVFVPVYDLVLLDLRCGGAAGGPRTCELYVANNGNVPVGSFKYQIDGGEGVRLSGTAAGALAVAGAPVWVPLPAVTPVPRNALRYLCASISPETGVDANPDNNHLCKALTSGFEVVSVWPNPVGQGSEMNMIVTTPKAGDMGITWYDAGGKQVFEGSYPMLKGYNRLNQQIESMGKGMYRVVFEFAGERVVRSVVVN